MCLRVDDIRHPLKEIKKGVRTAKPFVADRPLIVKKRVKTRFGYYSPYMNTPIIFGIPQSTALSITVGGYSGKTVVDQGFHAFCYNANYRSWQYRPSLKGPGVGTIYGVIPVGAKYYIGTNDEVVCDKITYYKSLAAIRKAFGVAELAEPHSGSYADGI